jgi:hypothetical protein
MVPTRRVLASLLVAGLVAAAALAMAQPASPQATPEQQHPWNETYAAFTLYLHLTAIAQQDCGVSAPTNPTLLYACTALGNILDSVRREYARLWREHKMPPTPLEKLGTMCP